MARAFSVQQLTDLALNLPVRFDVPVQSSETSATPALSGELLATDICPGLTATGHDITFLDDRDVDVDIGASLTCGVLLSGGTEPMLVPGHEPIAQIQYAPALFGFGGAARCTARWRRGQRCAMAGFLLRPEFFDRFGDGVSDDGLAPLQRFFRGDHRAASLAPSPAIARAAAENLRNPYCAELRALFVESNTLSLLIAVARLAAEGDRRDARLPPRRRKLLDEACERLDANLASPPSTVALARAVGTNVTTLQGLFNRVFGTTIFGYVQRRRLEVARVLVRERAGPMSEIARRVGFRSASAFSASYRRHFGHPPSLDG